MLLVPESVLLSRLNHTPPPLASSLRACRTQRFSLTCSSRDAQSLQVASPCTPIAGALGGEVSLRRMRIWSHEALLMDGHGEDVLTLQFDPHLVHAPLSLSIHYSPHSSSTSRIFIARAVKNHGQITRSSSMMARSSQGRTYRPCVSLAACSHCVRHEFCDANHANNPGVPWALTLRCGPLAIRSLMPTSLNTGQGTYISLLTW